MTLNYIGKMIQYIILTFAEVYRYNSSIIKLLFNKYIHVLF